MASDEMKSEASEAKRRRYDRQLRLWGAHGQEAMEECSVCLLNGSAVGTESLKNLVLPGIGSFTVVDGHTVGLADLGSNFFLDEASLGKPRAECVTQMLRELNEHVAGSYVNEDIADVLEARPDFLTPFTLVIATQLPARELKRVGELCAARQIALVVAQTYGFMGYLRLMLNEHEVVEAHPAHPFSDLRVLAPPAALRDFVAQRYADLGALTSTEYAHTPMVVLLLKAAEEWSSRNGGARPLEYKQKKEVKAIVEGYRRADLQADANVDEAVFAANTALKLPEPNEVVAPLLQSARARIAQLAAEKHAGAAASADGEAGASAAKRREQLSFWLMAAGVAAFVEGEGGGLLPLIGTIPDMAADTQTYVQLQSVYAQQAAADLAAVQAHVTQIASMEGLPADLVAEDALKRFCKNAHNLTVVPYRSLALESAGESAKADTLRGAIDDGASSGALYLLLRAAQAFRAERARWPGEDETVEADVPALTKCVVEVTKELNLNGGSGSPGNACPVKEELVHEFCRWGGAEMHSVASVVGGIAAQEAIKAVTHQYVPLNNTFIFNAMTGTAQSNEL